jgi:two-component system cell cycle response regulator
MEAVVVDLSKFLQSYLAASLNEAGIRVRSFRSGREALAAMEGGLLPSILCTSMVTEDLSGLELGRAVAANPLWKGVALVLVSSSLDAGLELAAREAGFREAFRKSDLRRFSDWVRDHAAKARSAPSFRGRILYVEDSPTAVGVLRKVLRGKPVELESRASVDDALEALATGEWDLVVADYTLEGGKTGLDLVRALRRSRKEGPPILVLSAVESQERKLEILESGANDFVAKPVVARELLARMGTLLENKHLIDELRSQKALFEELAMRDQLTALLNRRSLFEMAPRLVSEAARHGRPLSLILADVDHFKLINDSKGHAAGDLVLRELGAILLSRARGGDVVARFGGEEFVLLLPGCALEDARDRAEELRLAIEGSKPGGVETRASFGVASLGEGMDFEALFQAADAAVYRAKDKGRNRVEAG